MKFDIVKYISDVCEDYLQGRTTKAYTLSAIDLALDENSWQHLCDGKEVVSDGTGYFDDIKVNGGIVKAGKKTWRVHYDWCIEDKTEDKDK